MDSRLRRLSDWNFLVSQAWLFGASETGEVVERRDALISTCGLPVAEHNWSFPKDPVRDVEAILESAQTYFARKRLPYHFLVRDHLEGTVGRRIESAGFSAEAEVPCMVLAPISEPGVAPPELEVREVTSIDDLVAFREAAFEGFGLPVPSAKLFLTEPMLSMPPVRFYLGRVDGEPASTSALVATGEVAGIYWVATRLPFRGRGFGEAMTWVAIRGGLELGCRLASLQASQLGQPVYERMGFTHIGRYRRFGPRASDATA